MVLTGHNELNLHGYGGPQFVGGITAIGSLVLSQVPIIGYNKSPRILLFHKPRVLKGVEFLPILCPSESTKQSQY